MDFKGSARFAVRRRIGEGGMGVVYEAYDRRRGTDVALKTLRAIDGGSLYRFKKEFRSLSHLSHPNLVSLYELYSTGETWFFTMELIRGVNFLSWVRPVDLEFAEATIRDDEQTLRPDDDEGNGTVDEKTPRVLAPLNLDRLRKAIAQLATGVHALHDAGRLHRDLKPTNVMVDEAGRAVILDFGLVAELRGDQEFRSTLEHVVGTAGYMSPEQAMGKGIGPASDWYAVGAMLFEALVGRRPFLGRPMDVLVEKQRKPAPRPSEFDSAIPSDLDDLASLLLERDPRARPSGAEILERLGVERPEQQLIYADLTEVEPGLVGRDRELESLRAAFEQAKLHRPATVLIAGRSGTGKSALIRTFLSELRPLQDAVVFFGGCYEREAVPFKAFDDLIDGLSRFLRSLVPEDVEAILPEHVADLARVFPVLRQVKGISDAVVAESMRGTASRDPAEARGRAFRALRGLLGALCRRIPVVLAIDDLQWGDEDSAELLKEILRSPDPPPIMLVAAYRLEDADTTAVVSALAAVKESSVRAKAIELGALSLEDARALAALLLGGRTPELADRIAKESGGSPYFISELAMLDRISSADELTLDRVLSARIDAIAEPARRLLELIAVSGQPLAMSVAFDAAGLGKQQEQALAVLSANNLVRTRAVEGKEVELATYHERIRRVVLERMSPEMITACHRTLAVALELLPDPDPEVLSFHLLGANENARAAGFALKAARQARANLALEKAAALYRTALEELAAPSLEKEAAEAFAEAGRGLEAAELYLTLAARAGGEESTELMRIAAEQLLRTGHVERGVGVLEQVLARFGMSLAKGPVEQLTKLATARLMVRLRGLRFKRRSESRIERRDLERVDVLGSVATGLGTIDVIASSHFQSRHLLAALDAGEPGRIVRALAMEACYSAASGASNEKRTKHLVETTERLAWEVGDQPPLLGLASMAKGAAALLGGRFTEGERFSARGEETFRDHARGAQWEIATSGLFRLMSLAMLGRVGDLNRYVRANLRDALRRGDRYAAANLRSGYGNLAWLVGGDPDGAGAVLDQTVEHLPKGTFSMPHAYEMIARGNLLLYQREGRAAFDLYASKVRPLYERSLVPRVQFLRVEMAHLVARCALAAKEIAVAEERALALERENVGFAHALARLIRAGVEEARGKRSEARRAYARAARNLADHDMALHAAAAQRRQGLLSDTPESDDALEKAEAWLRGQALEDPVRFADVFAPHCS